MLSVQDLIFQADGLKLMQQPTLFLMVVSLKLNLEESFYLGVNSILFDELINEK